MQWFILVNVVLLLAPLTNTTIVQEYFVHFLFLFLLYWGGYCINDKVQKRLRIDWKKAKLNELKIEDSVLLQGIGIFQGILFIYLELAKTADFYATFLKWSIPIVTALFYILRGYGAIKNSSKHRFWSSLILINYLALQIMSLLNIVLPKYVVIYVGSTNLVSAYFSFSYILVIATFLGKIWNAMAIRYSR